jgi:hypothetical protein
MLDLQQILSNGRKEETIGRMGVKTGLILLKSVNHAIPGVLTTTFATISMKSIVSFIFFLVMLYAPASDAHSLQVMSNKLIKESVQEATPQHSFSTHDLKNPFFFIDDCFFSDDDEDISLRKKIISWQTISFNLHYLCVKPFHENPYNVTRYMDRFNFTPIFISLKVLKL